MAFNLSRLVGLLHPRGTAAQKGSGILDEYVRTVPTPQLALDTRHSILQPVQP